MSLTISSIQPFWASQSSLTSLIPASNVWVDVAGDGALMPYAIISQVSAQYDWQTGSPYLARTRFQITIYATTLAQVDQIGTAVKAAFKFAQVTSNAFGCFLSNEVPRAEDKGAYSVMLEFLLWENAS